MSQNSIIQNEQVKSAQQLEGKSIVIGGAKLNVIQEEYDQKNNTDNINMLLETSTPNNSSIISGRRITQNEDNDFFSQKARSIDEISPFTLFLKKELINRSNSVITFDNNRYQIENILLIDETSQDPQFSRLLESLPSNTIVLHSEYNSEGTKRIVAILKTIKL